MSIEKSQIHSRRFLCCSHFHFHQAEYRTLQAETYLNRPPPPPYPFLFLFHDYDTFILHYPRTTPTARPFLHHVLESDEEYTALQSC